LRLALTGQLGPAALAGEDVHAALALCVSCKACRRECPTGVDMAKMKIEATASRVRVRGVAARERLVAELPRYAGIARHFAPVLNWASRSGPVRQAGTKLGFAAGRQLPAWSARARRWDVGPETPNGDVLLFADTFNRTFEPENLRAAQFVLRAAGYRAVVPRQRLCCGRTYLSAGLVERARAEARRTVAALSQTGAEKLPVVGLEPSCLLTIRDEFRSLLPGAATDELAGRAVLLGEFLAGRELPAVQGRGRAHVHGHCHQKAFGAFEGTLKALRQVQGLDVTPIESSCCGMAGAFGYGAETEEVSRAMGERSLAPAVRAAAPDDWIVADGTSCRHQIRDLTGRRAVHSAVLLARALQNTPDQLAAGGS
ncbi:MAG: heterodisulfide reductase-related iron-sulfur binding cluster, partial [Pseudomonadota bacterium]|nr:heterodisulfide reductase-related iron-sulfur binding cluster [Pseudomonadota bacterium]